jgi:hypothetical protein
MVKCQGRYRESKSEASIQRGRMAHIAVRPNVVVALGALFPRRKHEAKRPSLSTNSVMSWAWELCGKRIVLLYGATH